MWQFGYRTGTVIKSRFTTLNVLKQGLKEWPEIYLGMLHTFMAVVGMTYVVYQQEKERDWVCRYKKTYTIYRKDDPRLMLYPKPFVTDSQHLPADHPMTTKEIDMFMLPPTKIHEHDPKRKQNTITEFFNLGKM